MTGNTDTGTPAQLKAATIRLRIVCAMIEALFEEKLEAFIGRQRYSREGATRLGYRYGLRDRQPTSTIGTETVRVPRTRIEDEAGKITE